jgi:hypothetical protein
MTRIDAAVVRVSGDQVWGRAYVPNPGEQAGCVIKVCLAEELGNGNWVETGCADRGIEAGAHNYYSTRVLVDCDRYEGTGYFRSRVRLVPSSGVIEYGPERRVC